MLTSTSILKRLETLEKHNNGKEELKAFIYYPERSPPFWTPENPEAWHKSHPYGKPLILIVQSCRKHAE